MEMFGMQRFVCTHHKAGSTWVRKIMRGVCEQNSYNWIVNPTSSANINQSEDRGSEVTINLIRGGRYKDFSGVLSEDFRLVRFIRDPRDVLVSQYYSWKLSHQNNGPKLLAARLKLQDLDVKQGLLWLINNEQLEFATQMHGWPTEILDQSLQIRYEDLISDFVEQILRATQWLDIKTTADEAARYQKKFSFEARTKRSAGTDDPSSHLRKGIAGDWKNHFDDEIEAAFTKKYGDFSKSLGYS